MAVDEHEASAGWDTPHVSEIPRWRADLKHMSADQFLDWSTDHAFGRHELVGGEVIQMAPERAEHVVYKGNTYRALLTAIGKTSYDLRVFTDGLSVVTGEGSVREPDVVVNEGPLVRGRLTATKPAILVEVSSPSSIRMNEVHKLAEYARVPSIQHYIVVHPDDRSVVWYERSEEATTFRASFVSAGTLALDPYGIEVTIEDIFDDSAFI